MKNFTPREIVSELDRYIVGQHEAKRMVAIALRNRWRRQRVASDLQGEITPKNIIMMGPTGVGKTEIARRLAKLAQAPFLKVEASKFTEVGYVGKDVESMIRDLTDISVKMLKDEQAKLNLPKAKALAQERLLELLDPTLKAQTPSFGLPIQRPGTPANFSEEERRKRLEDMRRRLEAGEFEDHKVELDVAVQQSPMMEIFSGPGMESMGMNIKDMLGSMLPKQQKRRKVKAPEALELLTQEEAQRLIDMDQVIPEAIRKVEDSGIIFLDEIDKVAGRESKIGPDVSREGVQRDILPIVEGSAVNTKYGIVKTDHILFIAAGAFHVSKPSDLIPELQGRFPIRVELEPLGQEEFVRILTEPDNALTRQYEALMKTEGIQLDFTEDSIQEMARTAAEVNENTENIGARRLQTILEKLLEEISFTAPDMGDKSISINAHYVHERLDKIVKDQDLSRYIL